ncbi:hypothetical protein BJ742DRAFT_358186 [Cladochytrium replicatum]|nr:hypothetical protein BJ742DRAFT_358186 [Cladochytrium replicatum]
MFSLCFWISTSFLCFYSFVCLQLDNNKQHTLFFISLSFFQHEKLIGNIHSKVRPVLFSPIEFVILISLFLIHLMYLL